MIFNEINDDNFMLFAIRNHNNPEACTTEDFLDDLKLFRKLRTNIRKFLKTNKDDKFNLCINDIVHIHNIFGEASVLLLFYIVENEYYPYLKTFLVCLGMLPPEMEVQLSKIPLDPVIQSKFKAL